MPATTHPIADFCQKFYDEFIDESNGQALVASLTQKIELAEDPFKGDVQFIHLVNALAAAIKEKDLVAAQHLSSLMMEIFNKCEAEELVTLLSQEIINGPHVGTTIFAMLIDLMRQSADCVGQMKDIVIVPILQQLNGEQLAQLLSQRANMGGSLGRTPAHYFMITLKALAKKGDYASVESLTLQLFEKFDAAQIKQFLFEEITTGSEAGRMPFCYFMEALSSFSAEQRNNLLSKVDPEGVMRIGYLVALNDGARQGPDTIKEIVANVNQFKSFVMPYLQKINDVKELIRITQPGTVLGKVIDYKLVAFKFFGYGVDLRWQVQQLIDMKQQQLKAKPLIEAIIAEEVEARVALGEEEARDLREGIIYPAVSFGYQPIVADVVDDQHVQSLNDVPVAQVVAPMGH